MDDPLRDNAEKSRFELDVDGQTVFARYRRDASVLVISYVEAPPALRGTGAAVKLMESVVAVARAEGRSIQPLCGYGANWLRRHREHRDLLR